MERHAALPDGEDVERVGNVARQVVEQHVAGAAAQHDADGRPDDEIVEVFRLHRQDAVRPQPGIGGEPLGIPPGEQDADDVAAPYQCTASGPIWIRIGLMLGKGREASGSRKNSRSTGSSRLRSHWARTMRQGFGGVKARWFPSRLGERDRHKGHRAVQGHAANLPWQRPDGWVQSSGLTATIRRNASLILSCQPGPSSWKWSSTARSIRIETSSLTFRCGRGFANWCRRLLDRLEGSSAAAIGFVGRRRRALPLIDPDWSVLDARRDESTTNRRLGAITYRRSRSKMLAGAGLHRHAF